MTTDYAVAIEPHFVKNFWPGRDGYMPMAIVEHMMQGTIEETWSYFMGREGNFGVSAHYGIARDGRIWQFVRDEDTAWANGVLNKPDTSIDWLKEVHEEGVNANLVTLAIEYEGYSGESLTEAQYEAALLLHRRLLDRWEIPATADHILGHDRFDSVHRKLNPGPAFPWARLLQELNPSTSTISPAPPVQSEVLLTGYTADSETFVFPTPPPTPEMAQTWTMPPPAEEISKPEAATIIEPKIAEDMVEPEVTEAEALPALPESLFEPEAMQTWTLPPLEIEPEAEAVVAETDTEPEVIQTWATPQPEVEIEPEVAQTWTLPPVEEADEPEVAEAEVVVEPEIAEVWSMPAPVEEISEPEVAEVWTEPETVAGLSAATPELEEELPLPTPVLPNHKAAALETELEEPLTFAFDQSAITNQFATTSERDFLAELDNPGFDQELPPDLKAEQLPSLTEAMTTQPDLPDFNDFDSLFDEIADFNYTSTQPTEIKPFEIEGAPRSSAPISSSAPKEDLEMPQSLPPDEITELIYADISNGVVSAELANIRRRPSYDPATVMRTAEKDTRFQFDGYREGPELQGSTRWFHIAPIDGHGWIHSVLVQLDQPFNPIAGEK